MAVIKITDPTFLGESVFTELLVDTPTKRVASFSDGRFVTVFGKFNNASEAALDASPITRAVELLDAEGTQPVIDLSGLRIKLGDLGDIDKVSAGNDKIDGSDLNDDLLRFRTGGNDIINGGGGDDIVAGGLGKDKVLGGTGDDTLYLDAGGDTATGGAGSDNFIVTGAARGGKITDFVSLDDTITLSAAELFGETGPDFGDLSNSIKLTGKGNKTTISIDADGGGDSFVALVTVTGNLGIDLDAAITSEDIRIG